MLGAVLVLCVVACADADHHVYHHGPSTQSPQVSEPKSWNRAGTFRGSWMETRRGRRFQAYRGIRYAEPPIGELRFQPPVAIINYRVEVDATKDGPECPQPTYNDSLVDEDCLTLNVYTPNNLWKKPLPVVIFIHPGGFYSVSSRSDLVGPSYLLDRDMVLVTINYRLGSLGFLSTGDKHAPGNNGFKDQVVALRWVRRNIRAFGGDPGLVTISGYSAGSFSVMLHTVSPMSRGLFHRAISMSGSPISQIVIPPHQRDLAERQARLLNCPTDTSEAIIECLKTKTHKELGDSLDGMFEIGYDPVLLWKPTIEADFGQIRFLTKQPLESVCKGEMQAVPYIIGQTQDEFFWKAFYVLQNETRMNIMNDEWHRIAAIAFLLSGANTAAQADRLKQAYLGGQELTNDPVIADGLGKLYSDALIGFGAHRLANLLIRHSPRPVYFYEFTYIGKVSHYMDPDTNEPVGAAHHDDLLYLFNASLYFPPIPVGDTPDSHMVDKMTGIFYNFARYGNPNPRGDPPDLFTFSWPAMTPHKRQYLIIGKEFSVDEKLFDERFQVWDELYPLDYWKCT